MTNSNESKEPAIASSSRSILEDMASMTATFRQDELNQLTTSLDKCIHSQKPMIHSVFVSGVSGCGKSYLLDAFYQSITRREKPAAFVCRGKFDNLATSSAEPLTTLLQVLESLIECLVDDDSSRVEMWRERVKAALGLDLESMQERIPAIRYLLHDERQRSSFAMLLDVELDSDGYITYERDWGLERFRLACRSLLRVISRFHPVVIILDDLHSIERDSLDILRTWLLPRSQDVRLLLVATHQPIPKTHALYKLQSLLPQPNVVQLQLQPFPLEHIRKWLTTQVRVNTSNDSDDAKSHVESLSYFCHEITQGNGLQLAQLLCYLQTQNMLVFDPKLQGYSVDRKLIHDLLAFKKSLPVQRLLTRDERCLALHVLEGDAPNSTGGSSSHDPDLALKTQLDNLSETQGLIVMSVALLGNSNFSLETLAQVLVPLDNEDDGDQHCLPSLLNVSLRQRLTLLETEVQSLVELGLAKKAPALHSTIPLSKTLPGQVRCHHYYIMHNRVRQVAYQYLTTNASTLTSLHLLLGRRLNGIVQSSFENGTFLDESLFFNTAHQMNLAAIGNLVHDKWELVELVDINYRSSEISALKHSYFSALKYLNQAVELLKKLEASFHGTCLQGRADNINDYGGGRKALRDPWAGGGEETYRLMKKLSDAKCRIQLHCGLIQDSIQLSEQIITSGRNFADKKLAYRTKLLCLIKRQEYAAALELNLQILELLGYSFPPVDICACKRKEQVIRSVTQTRHMLQSRSDQDWMGLKVALPANDESSGTWQDVSDFMVSLGDVAALCDKNGSNLTNDYMVLAMLRLLQISLEQGLLPGTSLAFVSWSYVMAQRGEFQDAICFGRLGEKYTHYGLNPRCDFRAMALYHIYVNHWIRPLRDCLLPLSTAVDNLWNKNGCLELYFVGSVTRLAMSFFAGRPLFELETEVRRMEEMFEDYRVHFQPFVSKKSYAPLFQMIHNLAQDRGTSGSPAKLTNGEFMKHKGDGDIVEWWKATSNEEALQNYYLCVATAALFFGDAPLAGEMSNLMESDAECKPDFLYPCRLFVKGCAGYLLARSNRSNYNDKHKRQGDVALNQFDSWAQDGLVSYRHYQLILRALRMACGSCGTQDIIRTAFDKAIEQCGQSGSVHFEALASELAGHCFSEMSMDIHSSGDASSNELLATRYLEKARAGYREWTCQRKISQMHSIYATRLSADSEDLELRMFSTFGESGSGNFRWKTKVAL